LVTYEGAVQDDVASPGGRDLDPDEAVFRALADGQRRVLLDRLFERDGQTLAELCAALPHLSRFGVMKHLSVLEQASLVTTRRDGRHKVHFLNPVPIRGIHDRWISKYATPWVDVLAGLRHDLEQPERSNAAHHDAIA
jgi:DNA-binding transcriptional ArsR family regulator